MLDSVRNVWRDKHCLVPDSFLKHHTNKNTHTVNKISIINKLHPFALLHTSVALFEELMWDHAIEHYALDPGFVLREVFWTSYSAKQTLCFELVLKILGFVDYCMCLNSFFGTLGLVCRIWSKKTSSFVDVLKHKTCQRCKTPYKNFQMYTTFQCSPKKRVQRVCSNEISKLHAVVTCRARATEKRPKHVALSVIQVIYHSNQTPLSKIRNFFVLIFLNSNTLTPKQLISRRTYKLNSW